MEANCECQYTVTLTNEVIHRQLSETKDNFNYVPSIHEVEEEETDDEEYIYDEETMTKDIKRNTDATQNGIPDDSLYGNESFCSDESYNEDANTTSSSFNDSNLSFKIINHKHNKEDIANEEERFKDTIQSNQVINSIRYKSLIPEVKFEALKQIKSKRKNMSFTDEEMRKIEWENQLLLKKIMAQQKPKDTLLRNNVSQPRISSSAINRKKLQKKIENENILLLQRIQQTKSRVTSAMIKSSCRQTIFENP